MQEAAEGIQVEMEDGEEGEIPVEEMVQAVWEVAEVPDIIIRRVERVVQAS
jgi:hypothetical protein